VKRAAAVIIAVVFAAAPALVASHADHATPMYGGHVAEAGLFQAELVDAAGLVMIHITKHGEPFATQGGKAVVTAQGPAKTVSLQLFPGGINRFVAPGTLANSGATSATAVISLPGLPERTLQFKLE